MTYIAIEGVIGVGKTTLARYLQEALSARLILEVFEENPFLGAFYQDRDRYAFQTQMFFLLSRYRQLQHMNGLTSPLVSDYMFAKDALFARQTLFGDELMVYERVYSALSENIPAPNLVVYLRADTPVLMHRITVRDRPYERNMDESYIDSLRIAYEHYFADYDPRRFLRIDTNHLDIVSHEEDRREVIQRILSQLGGAPHQPALPGLGDGRAASADLEPQVSHPPQEASPLDVLMIQMEIQEDMGHIAHLLRQQVGSQSGAQRDFEAGLGDVLRGLLRLADGIGLDRDALLSRLR